MPDITELLSASARGPVADPDLGRIHRRAVVLRRRHHATLGSAALGLVLTAALLGRFAYPGGAESLDQMPATRVTAGPTGPAIAPTPAPTAAAAAPAASGAPAAVPRSRPSESPSASPAGDRRPAPDRTAAPADPAVDPAPPAVSCHVDTAGLAAGEERSCRFTATQDGGWRLVHDTSAGYYNRARADVEVTRGGRTSQYAGAAAASGSAACGNDIIQPGDVVTVTVSQTDVGFVSFDLGAGQGFDCRPTQR